MIRASRRGSWAPVHGINNNKLPKEENEKTPSIPEYIHTYKACTIGTCMQRFSSPKIYEDDK
jgi:hypothetical protein